MLYLQMLKISYRSWRVQTRPTSTCVPGILVKLAAGHGYGYKQQAKLVQLPDRSSEVED